MTTALARWFGIADDAPLGTVNPVGARHAAYEAQLALDAERERMKVTRKAAAALKVAREQNHWADLLYDSMEKSP